MAIIEQLVYGQKDNAAGTAGRMVLARSPGLSRDCVTEVTKVCENWGERSQCSLSRPALISVPLTTVLPSMPGRLFTVIWVNAGPPILFHAVVINEADYAIFGQNPFALAQEGIFVSKWAAGDTLERRDISPMSLAPLVSPLPSEPDAALIEEALRHFLVRNKVLMPIELNCEESDRFLALLVSALPMRAKRELRFASYAVTDRNKYQVAALYESGSSFRDWYRLLMAEMVGQLNPSQGEYLDKVKSCLMAGDLLGLEQISRRVPPDVVVAMDGPRRSKPDGVSAALSTPSDPTGRTADWASALTPVAPRKKARKAKRHVPTGVPGTRPRRRRSSRRGNIAGRISALAALVMIAVVSLYWMDTNGFALLPWTLDNEGRPTVSTSLLGVVDVGALYQGELAGLQVVDLNDNPGRRKKAKARALANLRLGAADELREQGQAFIELKEQGIQQSSRLDREAERLVSLARRGEILEDELRRLTLGYISIESGVTWEDLSGLDGRSLKARLDSLHRTEPARLISVAEDLTIPGLIDDLSEARRQVAGMAGLVSNLAGRRCDDRWLRSTERSATILSRQAPTSVAEAFSRTALDLVQVKQAEADANFPGLAFSVDYSQGEWMPESVQAALMKLRRRVARFGADKVPALVTSTIAFHDGLALLPELCQAADRDGLTDLLAGMESSRAVAFDPGRYGDHVSRARLSAFAALIASGQDSEDLSSRFFPDGKQQEARGFLALIATNPEAEDWNEVAEVTVLPFYARWARAEYRRVTAVATRRDHDFDTAWTDLRTAVRSINTLSENGQDWTAVALRAHGKAGPLVRRFEASFAGYPERQADLSAAARIDSILSEPRMLRLSGVTVRMGSRALAEPTEVFLELMCPGHAAVLRSEAFLIGPAAPAGTGWVGARELDVEFAVHLRDTLHVTVRAVEGKRILLEVDYLAEGENLLPGGLLRPRASTTRSRDGTPAGNLSFKFDEDFWRGLTLSRLE